eukprot:TRINITY_DN11584_c0_g1_i1.p1 TRINITY_DN11584_c0_g1~~TRINITY_DN11584_c0_g1_i1.p1  ORF type:complete len:1084 (+),score=270.74 TRINITY_DN11584_c0_g1_i1:113-3364(+)
MNKEQRTNNCENESTCFETINEKAIKVATLNCYNHFLKASLFEILALTMLFFLTHSLLYYSIFYCLTVFIEGLIVFGKNSNKYFTEYCVLLTFFSYNYIILANETFDFVFILLFINSSMITQCFECNLKMYSFCSILTSIWTILLKILSLQFNFGLTCNPIECGVLYFAIFFNQVFIVCIISYRHGVIQHFCQTARKVDIIENVSGLLYSRFIPKNILQTFTMESFTNLIQLPLKTHSVANLDGNYSLNSESLDSEQLSQLNSETNIFRMGNIPKNSKNSKNTNIFNLDFLFEHFEAQAFPVDTITYCNVPILTCVLPKFEESFEIFNKTDFLNFFHEYLVFFDKLVEFHNVLKIRMSNNVIVVTPNLANLDILDMNLYDGCLSDSGILDYERIRTNKRHSNEKEIKDDIYENDKEEKIINEAMKEAVNTLVKLGMVLNDVSKLCGVLIENEFNVSIGLAVGNLCLTFLGHSNHRIYSWGSGVDESTRLANIARKPHMSDRRLCIEASLLCYLQNKYSCSLFNIDKELFLTVHCIKMTLSTKGKSSFKDAFNAFPFNEGFQTWKLSVKPPFTSFKAPITELKQKSRFFLRTTLNKTYFGAVLLRILFLIVSSRVVIDKFMSFSKMNKGNYILIIIYNASILVAGPLVLSTLNDTRRPKYETVARIFFFMMIFHTGQFVAFGFTTCNVDCLLRFDEVGISNNFLLILQHELLWLVMDSVITILSFTTNVGFYETITFVSCGNIFIFFVGIYFKNYYLSIVSVANVAHFLRHYYFSISWIQFAKTVQITFKTVFKSIKALNLLLPEYASDTLLKNENENLVWEHKDIAIVIMKLDFKLVADEYAVSFRCNPFNRLNNVLKKEKEKAKIDFEIAKIQNYQNILRHIETIVSKYSQIKLIDWCDDQLLLVSGLTTVNLNNNSQFAQKANNFNRCSQLLNCIANISSMIEIFNAKNVMFTINYTSCFNYGDLVSGIFGDDRIDFYCYGQTIYEAIRICNENNEKLMATKEFVDAYEKSHLSMTRKLAKLMMTENKKEDLENCEKVLTKLLIPGPIVGLRKPKFIGIHCHRKLFMFDILKGDVFTVQAK